MCIKPNSNPDKLCRTITINLDTPTYNEINKATCEHFNVSFSDINKYRNKFIRKALNQYLILEGK